MKHKSLKFEIYGKTRFIRDIRVNDPNEFEAYYKNCFIRVQLDDETRRIYAWCTAPDGSYIVDGYITSKTYARLGATISDGIRECLENIFHDEKPEI